MIKEFYAQIAEIDKLQCISSLVGWDQQTYMPPNGAGERAGQIELLSRLIHERQTSPKFLGIVDELAERIDELNDDDKINVRETKRHLDRMRRLPESFVAEYSKVTSIAYDEWTRARPKNDFKSVEGYLKRIIDLCREEAKLIGYSEHPYDALLDKYERSATLSYVSPLLSELGEALSKLIPTLVERTAHVKPLSGSFRIDQQIALCERITKDIGFSYASGRLDKTHHPFQTTLGTEDVRITTRYDTTSYLSAVFTALHEAGHALYEYGLPKTRPGTPLCSPVSLGIHESQSRLWENIIGRSRAFAGYLKKTVPEYFPEERERSAEFFWDQTNKVSPSLVRVEADEVTYSLHVVIRMLLEADLFAGKLEVQDLPEAWDKLYEKYLGIKSPELKDGVLQDVHWYCGLVGYFPTYALGNLYGAMFMERIRAELPNLDAAVSLGEFEPLLTWLRKNVHAHGKRYAPRELIKLVAGRDLEVGPFIGYIKEKFGV